MLQCFVRGGIAHLVERLHGMQEVWGSSPHISTKNGIKLRKQPAQGRLFFVESEKCFRIGC